MLLQLKVFHREYDSVLVARLDDPNAFLFVRIIIWVIWRLNDAVRCREMTAAHLGHVHEDIRSDESVARDTRIGVEQYGERAGLRRYVGRLSGTAISKMKLRHVTAT